MATRYVAAQPVAAPNHPVAREISGNLAISGDVGKEDSARKPGGRLVRFQIFLHFLNFDIILSNEALTHFSILSKQVFLNSDLGFGISDFIKVRNLI